MCWFCYLFALEGSVNSHSSKGVYWTPMSTLKISTCPNTGPGLFQIVAPLKWTPQVALGLSNPTRRLSNVNRYESMCVCIYVWVSWDLTSHQAIGVTHLDGNFYPLSSQIFAYRLHHIHHWSHRIVKFLTIFADKQFLFYICGTSSLIFPFFLNLSSKLIDCMLYYYT